MQKDLFDSDKEEQKADKQEKKTGEQKKQPDTQEKQKGKQVKKADKQDNKDVLLVHDKETNKVQVVTGIEDGEVKRTPAKLINGAQFLEVEKDNDMFANFFKNFTNQLNDPTRYNFYKVAKENVEDVAKKVDKYIVKPTAKLAHELSDYMVDMSQFTKQQKTNSPQQAQDNKQTQPQADKKPYVNFDKVDWEKYKGIGITRERIEGSPDKDRLLAGYISNEPFKIKGEINGMKVREQDVYLSFQHNKETDKFVPVTHGLNEKVAEKHYNHVFNSTEYNKMTVDKEAIVVGLMDHRINKIVPTMLAADPKTNAIHSIPVENIKIRANQFKGADLKDAKETLQRGGIVELEINKFKGEGKELRRVQYCPVMRGLKVLPYTQEQKQQMQEKKANAPVELMFEGIRVPKTLMKEPIPEQSQKNIAAGMVELIPNIPDGKGGKYSAYLYIDAKTNPDRAILKGKDPRLTNPQLKERDLQARAQAAGIPVEQYKTQVAVNKEGKTNEATKHIDKPLKQGQTTPTGEQKKKQEEKKGQNTTEKKTPAKTQKRSSGRKMK